MPSYVAALEREWSSDNERGEIAAVEELAKIAADPAAFLSSHIGYAVVPWKQGRGYATEAARALISYAFDELDLRRIVATTEHENLRSVAVMRRLGMTIERNPEAEPHWFQTVGVLANPGR